MDTKYVMTSQNAITRKKLTFKKWLQMNRHFNKKLYCVERGLALLVQKMQIKTTMQYHHTPNRIRLKGWPYGIISEVVTQVEFSQLLEEWSLVVPAKAKQIATIQSSLFYLGIYSRKMKVYIHAKFCTQMFTEQLYF